MQINVGSPKCIFLIVFEKGLKRQLALPSRFQRIEKNLRTFPQVKEIVCFYQILNNLLKQNNAETTYYDRA